MPLVPSAVLPAIVLGCAGCLFFIGGRLWNRKWPWAAAGLAGLAAAAWFVRAAELAQSPSAAVSGLPVLWDSLAAGCHWTGLGLGGLFVLMRFDAHRDPHASPQDFGWLLLMLAGWMLVSVANDLIVMFLALEVVGVSLTLLIIRERSGSAATEAGLKHFLLGLLASILLLFGFSFLFGLTATTNLDGIRETLAAGYAPVGDEEPIGRGSRLGTLALVFIFAGLGFRIALVPFHFSLPDVTQGTTPWNAGLLLIISKAAGLIAVVRVATSTLAGFEATGLLLTLILAAATMTLGNVLALLQTEIRRLLAYTTIAHGGLIFVGAAIGFWDFAHPVQSLQAGSNLPGGVQAALFSLFAYALAIAGLVGVLVYLSGQDRSSTFVNDLAGLYRTDPLAAVAAAILLLSLAGVPPLPGFWGRLAILASALNVHDLSGAAPLTPHPALVVLAIVIVVNLLLTAGIYLRIVVLMFFDPATARPRRPGRQAALATALMAALLTLGIGLLPGPLLDYCRNIPQPHHPQTFDLSATVSPIQS